MKKTTKLRMYSSIKVQLKDRLLWYGWILLLISSFLFCASLISDISSEKNMPLFFIHFLFGITYFFALIFNRKLKIQDHRVHYQLIKLMLFLISCYALNREMDVFSESTTWFSIVLILLCLNYVSASFFNLMPVYWRHINFFMYGVASFVFAYLAIYLLPLYMLSIVGIIALGISIHTFIPLFFCFATIFLAIQLAQKNRKYWRSFYAGILSSIVICVVFVAAWNSKVENINQQYVKAMAEGENKLPLWIKISQNISTDIITEKILKCGLIYKIPRWDGNVFWNAPTRNFGEQRLLHDPLVNIAMIFSSTSLLEDDDKIKILKSQYHARHDGFERLWTGKDLKTEQVSTTLKVWPTLHMAYTEKMITVYNHHAKQIWSTPDEGIYTFHLPEGAVVTSLSLWINGKEEKGILTSKQKAATAYTTLVGVENRDPSVVHWQEGNTVSVRVFPIMAQSSRTFKIGITAPLKKEGSQLVYENIWFEGPSFNNAIETVNMEIPEGSCHFNSHESFAASAERKFFRSGSYVPYWSLLFEDTGLQPNVFCFNNSRYSLQSYVGKRMPMHITDVFLDINKSWSDAELNKVWQMIKDKKVWVYEEEMQLVSESNKDYLFAKLQSQSFSLFPFYKIGNKEQALVISKSIIDSPNFDDLEGSNFFNQLQTKYQNNSKTKVFHIGKEYSPYIRTLNEMRFFNFESGTTELLEKLLTEKLFDKNIETDNEVVVHSAEMRIVKEPRDAIVSATPDHVMRLFAYNHILQQMAKTDSTFLPDSSIIIKEAEEAYIVSPVSSLIVLESQSDYDRFGIKDSEQSLKNASIKNKGAVPEPAEWAVLLVFAVFLLFFLKTKLM